MESRRSAPVVNRQQKGQQSVIRLGLVGTNTSHAPAFARIFNGDAERAPALEGGTIVAVWGDETGEAREMREQRKLPDAATLARAHNIATVVAEPGDMIGRIDAVLVVDDTGLGATHGRLARQFIAAGIPTYIDKPMTLEMDEAIELFDLAEQRGGPVMSASALRFAREIAELQERLQGAGALSSVLSVGPGDWFNYGVHAVEMYQTVVGLGARWVQSFPDPRRDVVVVGYDEAPSVVVETLRDAGYVFHLVAYGAKGWSQCEVKDFDAFYTRMMAAVLEMARTGRSPVSRDETLEVLAVLHAALRSAETGARVQIADVLAR
jgi:predicted dehydrogenase